MAVDWDKSRYDLEYQHHAYSTRWGIPAKTDGEPTPKLIVGYARGLMVKAQQARVDRIIANSKIPAFSSVAVIGGGIGLSVEAFEVRGISAVHTEISDYLLQAEGTSEEAEWIGWLKSSGLPSDGTYRMYGEDGKLSLDPLDYWGARKIKNVKTALQEDLGTTGSRSKVRRALNGGMNCIISELVLESLSDLEVEKIIQDMERTKFNSEDIVIHLLVANSGNPIFNSKTLKEWKALITAAGMNHIVVDTPTFEVL